MDNQWADEIEIEHFKAVPLYLLFIFYQWSGVVCMRGDDNAKTFLSNLDTKIVFGW